MKKEKDWKIPFARPRITPALEAAGFTPLLTTVLALRGVEDGQQARQLIYGGADCIHDPMLMTGMAEARERILQAVDRDETVAVYGDYDVDGITSTCLVTDYLRSRGLNCIPYIPDRNEEGYGLNCAALDSLKAQGVSLVVTVDCGITAVEETEHARALGIDMVITDHHECKHDALPKAVALIDCKQEGDRYPNKDLAGVGVALKLVCACEGDSKAMLDRYADLVAIGTVADVMPLVDENRYMVKYGLALLEKNPRPGIAAMLRESSIDPKKLSASVIGYSLAPRLNAAGRLGNAGIAAKLLMSRDPVTATNLAVELCDLNRRRQSIETEIWQEANQLLSGKAPDSPIVLASDKWHQGVIGIAASRLAEQYSLPAIMICLNGDVGKGSCRSYGGFNLFDALSSCSEHLLGFGGHALAAGLNIRKENLPAFRQALADYYRSNKPEHLPEVQCDLLITDPALLSIDNVKSLDLLEPYGNCNPKPLMCISAARLESASQVGNGRHLRIRIRFGDQRFEGIFFSHSLGELGLREGNLVDVAFRPQINEYRGSVSVQLVVSALRRHTPEPLCDAILSGDESALWAASAYCPARTDFVHVWRAMDEGFTVGGDTRQVLSQCLTGMEPERFCLCLMTLLETGLLQSASGRVFSAVRSQISGKADLEGTRLMRRLRSYL